MRGIAQIVKVVLIASVLSLDAAAQNLIPPGARHEAVIRFEHLAKTTGKGEAQRMFRGCVPRSELDSVRLDWAELGAGWPEIGAVDLDSLLVSSESDLVDQADYCYYHFPLIYNDRLLGAIRVKEDREEPGNYTSKNRIERHNYGYRIDIFEHRKVYPAADGYSISVLHYLHFGTYIVVFKSSKALLMAPTDKRGAYYLSMVPSDDNEYPFVPVTQAVPSIKEGYWNAEVTQIERQLAFAELVIVGTISDVKKRFAIVSDDSSCTSSSYKWNFNIGLVRIDKVLFGELDEWTRKRGSILISFFAVGSREKEYGRYNGYPMIKDGDSGVWMLRRDFLTGYDAVFCRECYLPEQKLQQVERAISNVGN